MKARFAGGRMKKPRKEFSSFIPHPSEERKTTMETEKKPQTKKEWKTPELIVLVRSNPEEAVLAACKSGTDKGAGTKNKGCYITPVSACSVCLLVSIS